MEHKKHSYKLSKIHVPNHTYCIVEKMSMLITIRIDPYYNNGFSIYLF